MAALGLCAATEIGFLDEIQLTKPGFWIYFSPNYVPALVT